MPTVARVLALAGLGRFAEVLDVADRALADYPEQTDLLVNRALALLHLGRFKQAIGAADRVLTIMPESIEAHVNKAAALLQLERFSDALAVIDAGLALSPEHGGLLLNRITALLGLRRDRDALDAAVCALAYAPQDPALLLNKAIALIRLGHVDETLDDLAKGWTEAPARSDLFPSLLDELLECLGASGTVDAMRRLLSAHPGYWDILGNQCLQLLFDRDFLEETVALGRTMQEADPARWDGYAFQGVALAAMSRFDEAMPLLLKAQDANPQKFGKSYYTAADERQPDKFLAPVDARLVYIDREMQYRLYRCDWSRRDLFLDRMSSIVKDAIARGKMTPIQPFYTLSLPLSSPMRLAIARSHAHHLAKHTREFSLPEPAIQPPHDRLRIGYVSADFINHPTAHLMQSMVALHNREHFEVFYYSLAADDGSAYYRRFAADAEHFVDLTPLSNRDAALRIRSDEIDILIDLMGYTRCARTEIFALQPAPIQAAYLGFAGTLGADFIPYIIADPIVLPESEVPHFSEQPIYLPECYQVNDRWQPIAETGARRADYDLPEDAFVFCCFNANYKIEPVIFDVWMRILQRVPESMLWLFEGSEYVSENLRREAQARGVAPERLVFAARVLKDGHLERHRLADLCLDTLIYGAHTTASDALWAGVPVLTCCGEAFASRVGASLLTAIGLPEMIVNSLAEYEDLAVELATRPQRLTEIRQKLASNRLTYRLFDTERFVRHLETAFEMMWAIHAAGEAPRPIYVPKLPS